MAFLRRETSAGAEKAVKGGRTVVRKKERVRLLPFLYCSAKVTRSRRGTTIEASERESLFLLSLRPLVFCQLRFWLSESWSLLAQDRREFNLIRIYSVLGIDQLESIMVRFAFIAI